MTQAAKKELAFRQQMSERIAETKQQLIDLGVSPSIQITKQDSEQVVNLRLKLRKLQQQAQSEPHPVSATSSRG
jgi:hypothetical protein